jgi:hypothetical protein
MQSHKLVLHPNKGILLVVTDNLINSMVSIYVLPPQKETFQRTHTNATVYRASLLSDTYNTNHQTIKEA